MLAKPLAYLVVRLDQGIGDVFPLDGTRQVIGKLPSNPISIRDDLCSREHAAVYFADGHWILKALRSHKDKETLLNGEPLHGGERRLKPTDEIRLGETRLVFFDDLQHLPPYQAVPEGPNLEVILKRQYQHLDPLLSTKEPSTPVGESGYEWDLGRLNLEMRMHKPLEFLGRAVSAAGSNRLKLNEIVLRSLMGFVVPADGAALLSVREDRVKPLASVYRPRYTSPQDYPGPSNFIREEVLLSNEAVLVENARRDDYLRHRRVAREEVPPSEICAPVLSGDRVIRLIHLFCANPWRALLPEDLEFVVRVARQTVSAYTLPLPEADGPTSRDQGIEAARQELRAVKKALEDAFWHVGKASLALFSHRSALTRQVDKLFDRFPELREEQEFSPLAERFRLNE